MLLTYFVVQSFEKTGRGALAAHPPVQAQNEEHALRLASRLSKTSAGVIAFSRCGDPETGEFEDAVVLFTGGAVPIFDTETAIAC
jgi:aspartate oxidase